MTEKPKCLNPNCSKESQTRGLCGRCYESAARLVRLGHTTWDKLAASGKTSSRKNVTSGERSAWLLS